MMRKLLSTAAVTLMILASGCRQEPAVPKDQGPPAESVTASGHDAPANDRKAPEQRQQSPDDQADVQAHEQADDQADDQAHDLADEQAHDPPEVRTYNTGDSDVWPSYDLPLVITVEVPEVPEGIMRPSRGISSDED